ncbi:MAG: CPBP family intramembrane metalloprotease [Bacilli bacterium]|nr:CPBP family intramembrane metalloprotease [Bacilli bacterium]
MKKARTFLILGYLGISVVAAIVLMVVKPVYNTVEQLQNMISDLIIRATILSGIVVLYFGFGYHKTFGLHKESWRMPYWVIPCLVSVLANFPFSALILGKATIDYPNYIWVFVLYCLSISLVEELLFRVILLDFLLNYLEGKNHKTLIAIILDSAIFGLYHLLNLAAGAGVIATLMQVGYTFLVGGMFAITLLKTKNILYPLILHAIFDAGGYVVTCLGQGAFQDMVFWILTGVTGAMAAIHCLYALYQLDKEESELRAKNL